MTNSNGYARRILLACLAAASLYAVWSPRCAAAVAVPAPAADKMSADLETAIALEPESTMIPVIVRTKGNPSPPELLRVLGLGGILRNTAFDTLKGYAATVRADKLSTLALGSDVVSVSYDRAITPFLDVANPVAMGKEGDPPAPGGSGGAPPVFGGVRPGGDGQVPGIGGATPPKVPVLPAGRHPGRNRRQPNKVQIPVDPGEILPLPELPFSPCCTGQGITIALVDSGVTDHPDLHDDLGLSRVIWQQDFTGGGNPADEYGHGTHVAGILAGNASRSSGPQALRTFRGLAPDAKIVSLKVLDAEGIGRLSSLLDALDWVLLNRHAFDIRVVNLSIGSPVFESADTDPLCVSVEKLVNAGIVVVVSAGNWGRLGAGSVTSPGIAPSAITVGAYNDRNSLWRGDDAIASYSSRGPTWPDHLLKPDLVAPGNRVPSLRAPGSTLDTLVPENILPPAVYTTDPQQQGQPGQYFELSGTSMAAPIVAGGVAQMLEEEPSLSPASVKARLMLSARKEYGQSPYAFGAGLVNIGAALAMSTPHAGSAPSPHVLRSLDDPGALEVESPGDLWGQPKTFTPAAVYGSGAVWGDAAIWGDSAIWGDTAIWGDGAIWADGRGAVWGDSHGAIWGDTILMQGD